MKPYSKFPLTTVAYNALTLGGAFVAGAVIVAQIGWVALAGYAALLLIAVGGVLATVCTRCGYRGRRCGLGMGLIVGWLNPRDAAQYFRTVPQVVYTLLLIVTLLAPLGIGVARLIADFSLGRLVPVTLGVGLLLAGLVPHPTLVCRHCQQGACGACPVGRRFAAKAGSR